MRSLIAGATGHSQGVGSAVCIIASSTLESFLINTAKTLRLVFYCGFRGQERFQYLHYIRPLSMTRLKGAKVFQHPCFLSPAFFWRTYSLISMKSTGFWRKIHVYTYCCLMDRKNSLLPVPRSHYEAWSQIYGRFVLRQVSIKARYHFRRESLSSRYDFSLSSHPSIVITYRP